MTTFYCDECKINKTHPSDSCTTGYGVRDDGSKICFDCCGIRDKQIMIKAGNSKTLPLYLVVKEAQWWVTNWPNTLSFQVHHLRKGKHNIAGTRYDVWFQGPDNKTWHGTQYGDWTQIVHCKRIKK